MLAKDWNQRQKSYDVAVIGSGYGGAITAARISGAGLKKSVCILERGKEWPVGQFPDTLLGASAAAYNPLTNPLGLYDFLLYKDIGVIKGSGLGGTSLVNANVAIVPDDEVFKESLGRAASRATYSSLTTTEHTRCLGPIRIRALFSSSRSRRSTAGRGRLVPTLKP